MRVEYQAGTGTVTERIRVDLTPQEADALADLHNSLFVGKDDPIATGLRKIATEWKLDQDGALFNTSVPGDSPLVASAESRNGGSPE